MANSNWMPKTVALERIGLVSGAVFSDLNGDGFPDSCLRMWGPEGFSK
jgi:hypothetical protein